MTDSILLSLSLPSTNKDILNEEIDEMKQLALTLGYKIQPSLVQNRKTLDSSTYFGKGKINSVVNQCNELKYKTLFINDELDPGHFKRIQKIAGKDLTIIDRTKLILDIFNNHAKTVEAKKQIELAALEYMMPRLVGQWTHLERQMGGIGGRGGPGEKQIEIDRRLLRKDINKLKKDLKNIEKQRKTQRKSRTGIFKVALTGYTNAGKSSLLKALTGYEAYIKDQLFATLDTTTKKIRLDNNMEILISDTVGFLRNLPHDLIASFRSTLGEIEDCDLIIKLIDITTNDISGHIQTIDDTLKFLNCENKNYIIVFNKIDVVKDLTIYDRLQNLYPKSIFISSLKELRINNLLESIKNHCARDLPVHEIKIPYIKSSIVKEIYNHAIIVNRKDEYDYIYIKMQCTNDIYKKIKKKIVL